MTGLRKSRIQNNFIVLGHRATGTPPLSEMTFRCDKGHAIQEAKTSTTLGIKTFTTY